MPQVLPRIFWPVAIGLAALTLLFELTGLDLQVTRWHWDGQTFPWKQAWFTAVFSHKWVKAAVWVVFFVALFNALFNTRLRYQVPRRRWVYLSITMLLIPAIAGVLRSLSTEPCPWDTTLFGGDLPMRYWFESWPEGVRKGRCFPAGHSSGGFSLLAWYFALYGVKPRQARWALLIAVAVGVFMSVTQQMRGAHFVSHSLATATLAWCIAGAGYALLIHWERKKHVA